LNAGELTRNLVFVGGAVAQIFLSYSRRDAEAAKTIATALRERGHGVWWDKQISGGSKFAAEIEQALGDADVVMVLWSVSAIASSWVLDEAAEGRDTGRLLPVALDRCKPPLGFRQYQTIDAASGLDEAVDDVLSALDRRSGEHVEAHSNDRSPDPNSAEAHCARARHLEAEGRFAEAQREIDGALRIDPESWEANRDAGRLLYMQGRPTDAIDFLEKAVSVLTSDHDSPALLISCYRAVQDDRAMKRAAGLALTRAEYSIASTEDVGLAFASGAKGLAALGHRDRARKWLRKALNVDPGNLSMRYALAATLAAFLGDAEAAIDVLESFVERASNRVHLQLLEADPDWNSVRELAAFRSLLARARKRVDAIETTKLAGTVSAPPSVSA